MNTLVTVGAAAERLAVSRSMVRKLLATGKLTRVRIGRCVRIRADELEALAQGTAATPPNPALLADDATFMIDQDFD